MLDGALPQGKPLYGVPQGALQIDAALGRGSAQPVCAVSELRSVRVVQRQPEGDAPRRTRLHHDPFPTRKLYGERRRAVACCTHRFVHIHV